MIFKWTEKAEKAFSKINKTDQIRILDKIDEIELSDNPMGFLLPYGHDLAGLHKLRVGKYRVINLIINEDDTAYIVSLNDRNTVYSKQSKNKIKSIVSDLLDALDSE